MGKCILLLAACLSLVLSQNISVSNTLFDGAIVDVQWCGKDVYDQSDIINDDAQVFVKKVLFSKSSNGEVYKSFDNGKQWYMLQNVFEKELQKVNVTEKVKIQKMIRSKSENQHMYFLGDNGLSFFSSNCGLSYELIRHDPLVKDIKPNLSQNSSILLVADMDCHKYPVICKYSNWAYVSLDNGKTIKKYDKMVLEIEWAKQDRLFGEDIPHSRMVLTTISQQDGQIQQKVQYSDDYMATTLVVEESAYRFYLSEQHLYLLCVQDMNQQSFSLQLANLTQYRMRASEVEVPIKRMKDHSFTVLDATVQVIFININHLGDNSKFGNVYSSNNVEASAYTLSLLYNVRSEEGFVDFKRLDSMEGSYIANHYEHQQAEKFKNYLENVQSQGQSKDDQQRLISTYAAANLDGYKKSVISFNEGVDWEPIAAPEKDMYGQHVECNGECSLHFKGITDQLGNQIYSDVNSPGIIVGVGNVGMYLSNDPHEMNTYLSRDGGHVWKEIRKGSYHYSVGDKGGLIVLGKEHGTTDSIIYSWDEGISFEEVKISNYQIQIKDILIEPTEQALNFIVVGSTKVENDFKNIIIGLDFESLHTRECTGHYKPNAPTSDYELWTMHSQRNSGCIMGRKTTIIRKKQGIRCYNSDQFFNTITSSPCLCQANDFECAPGFQMVSRQCEPIDKDKVNPKPFNCKGFYLGSSGYVKIPGNDCKGGDEKNKQVQLSCITQERVDSNQSVGGIVSGKIIGAKASSPSSSAQSSPSSYSSSSAKPPKKKKGQSLSDFEAFGENTINEKQDMANYKIHLDEVEKINQEQERVHYRNRGEVQEVSGSRQNVKVVLVVLMVLALLVFLREHILQVVIDIQSRLRNAKPSYDYAAAGEPTNRFDLDATEFKSLDKEDEDEF